MTEAMLYRLVGCAGGVQAVSYWRYGECGREPLCMLDELCSCIMSLCYLLRPLSHMHALEYERALLCPLPVFLGQDCLFPASDARMG